MVEYLLQHLWAIWTLVAMVCLIMEMSSGDFYITCFGIGAVIALIASLFAAPFWIGQSYMTDGIREYNTGYPSVALGWMMFIGMAVAKYWDVEWEVYGKVPDLYVYLRDRIDFDHMDDYILDKVLCLDADTRKKMNDAVAESASRTYNMMSHMCLESGTAAAMRAFTAALHQMYVMGVAVELKALGYHMTKL